MDTEVRVRLRVAPDEEQDGLYKSQLNAEGRMAFSSYEKILNVTMEEEYVGASEKLLNHSTNRDSKEIWANFARYLKKEWLPHKKLCVRAWTNSIRNYGMDTTLPGESAHAGLKGWLRNGKANIVTFFQKIGPFYDNHRHRYDAKLAQLKNSAPTQFTCGADHLFYSKLVRILPIKSLMLLREKKEKRERELVANRRAGEKGENYEATACNGVYSWTMGLPCSHKLVQYLSTGTEHLTVTKEDFDPWRIIPNPSRVVIEAEQRIQEPNTIRRARSKRISNSHSSFTGISGTRPEVTWSERVVPDHEATPPANMPVSAALIGRRYGQPPPPIKNARGSLTAPFDVAHCKCKTGCGTRSCPCRKAGKICRIYCHINKTFCKNMNATDIDDNNDISLLDRNTSGMCYNGSESVPRSISPKTQIWNALVRD
ncbi:hypothetical protein GcM3_141010 [Golovinomyces cichoracearum]|uniref:Uncharacterized protein n=1 Tax=Golovinomyces cichoracearum TaxID=62708 RepID=A0A420I0C6_9PEZI|nr:hypothetical protein GcM3_141010 [Golovinomyces cichoracearum]